MNIFEVVLLASWSLLLGAIIEKVVSRKFNSEESDPILAIVGAIVIFAMMFILLNFDLFEIIAAPGMF